MCIFAAILLLGPSSIFCFSGINQGLSIEERGREGAKIEKGHLIHEREESQLDKARYKDNMRPRSSMATVASIARQRRNMTDSEATSRRPVRSRGVTRPNAAAYRTSDEHEAQLRCEHLVRFVRKRESANCKGLLGYRVRASTRNIGSLTIPSSTLQTVALKYLPCDTVIFTTWSSRTSRVLNATRI